MEGHSRVCAITNLELRRGADGHWLEFKTRNGEAVFINIENVFYKQAPTIGNSIIRQWAVEQDELCACGTPIDKSLPQCVMAGMCESCLDNAQ